MKTDYYDSKKYCPFIYCKSFSRCDKAYRDKVYTESKKQGKPVHLFVDEPDCFETK